MRERQADGPEMMLEQLISQGEHRQQDFKYKVMDAAKLAKSVSAFANTDGGRLIIGVRDDRMVSGVTSEEEIFMMETAARRYCLPAIDIGFNTIRYHGKQVVLCEIKPSEHRPVYALDDIHINHDTGLVTPVGKATAYVRIHDENIVASPVHLQIWKEQRNGKNLIIHYSDHEKTVIQTLKDHPGETLNHIVRHAGINRRKVIVTLARLIRYGIADCAYANDKQFRFSLL